MDSRTPASAPSSGAPPRPAPAAPGRAAGTEADRLARGVCRFLAARGYSTLTEFPVGSGRRVDVVGLNRDRHFVVVEIKTSPADFRSDAKWPDYLPWCDAFYFAVPDGFPAAILPADRGLLVADAFDAAVLREAPPCTMNPARRRAQILRFALTAGQRLQQRLDTAVPR